MSFARRGAGALIADACIGIGTAPLAMRILLIEDDAMIGRGLLRGLSDQGITVDWVRTGPDGGAALKQGDHSLVLLDLGLPGKSGFDLIRHARAAHNAVPILVITARDSLEDRIKGLDLGADDYLIKPFELKELLARMRAVFRRQHGQTQSLLVSGDITLDLATLELEYRNMKRVLSAREFALMRVLMLRPGNIVSRAQIEQQIYGWGEEVESNAVDVLIHSIRKRFDKEIVRNVRGAGWMVVRDPR
jgi:two-component system OmpR family response regulator